MSLTEAGGYCLWPCPFIAHCPSRDGPVFPGNRLRPLAVFYKRGHARGRGGGTRNNHVTRSTVAVASSNAGGSRGVAAVRDLRGGKQSSGSGRPLLPHATYIEPINFEMMASPNDSHLTNLTVNPSLLIIFRDNAKSLGGVVDPLPAQPSESPNQIIPFHKSPEKRKVPVFSCSNSPLIFFELHSCLLPLSLPWLAVILISWLQKKFL